MDTTGLMLSLLFGLIGTGLFLFGKREGRVLYIATGLALMVLPPFLPGVAAIIVSLILCAVPFLLREA